MLDTLEKLFATGEQGGGGNTMPQKPKKQMGGQGQGQAGEQGDESWGDEDTVDPGEPTDGIPLV